MEREFNFTTQDFQRVRELIRCHAGISLADSKQELVYSRVSRRLRATGLKSFSEYLNKLEQGDEGEWEAFANSLTTNLTAFFREAHHFQILAEHLRKQEGKGGGGLWCSACSTGEEPYSMAMTVVEVFGGFVTPVNIIATDIDTNVLETARKGVYPIDQIEKLGAERIKRFFLRGTGVHSGYAKVRPELQRMVSFRKLNLLDTHWPLREQMDAIFCRNVMIYFDKQTQIDILKKFAPLLKFDGLLFAGHSENFFHADQWFRSRGKTVYELASRNSGSLASKLEQVDG